MVANWDTNRHIWGIPQPLDPFINDPNSDNTNPFCGMVGKKEVLFFSSNRKGQSAGGYDLWYSVYDPKQKTYRRPQNVGKKINTNRDEKTPWYDSKKGILFLYNPYEIAAYAYGEIELFIPFEDVKSVVNPRFLQ